MNYAIGKGHVETIAVDRNRRPFPVDICISQTLFGQDPIYVAVIRDITELRKQQELLEHQALHDSLTGLPNRLLLNDRVEHALAAAKRNDGRTALLLLDLDRFKQVNDTLGHHIGDLLLKDLAKRLLKPVRSADTVARLGGDEFAILLPEIDSLEQALQLAERVKTAFDTPFEVMDNLQLDVGCSIGIGLYPDHTKDAARLMQCADVAMYAAKTGTEKIVVYDPSKDGNSMRRLTLSSELKQAIGGGELTMEFQPKYDMELSKVTGFEALCRWFHPRLGKVPPDEFVLHAEQTGIIPDLTRWTFEAGLAQLAQFRHNGLDIDVALNLSARMLHDETIPMLLRNMVRDLGVPAERVVVEITESAIVLDPAGAKTNAKRLCDAGFRLSIDDFGTGYSSLSFLQSMPLHEIKIDRSFVIDMLVNNASTTIVRSTIDLAHNLGLKVVAEGVETREHFNRLMALKADVIQGYFVAPPISADAVGGWLRNKPVRKLERSRDHSMPQQDNAARVAAQ